MKYKVKVVFGKEPVDKFLNDIKFTQEETQINFKEFEFRTSKEKSAFCKGINEAAGWTECYIL